MSGQVAVALVGVAVTLLLFLVVNLLAVGVAYGKMKQWTLDYEHRESEKWAAFVDEAKRRWDRIEKKVGISNGGAEFMPRTECVSLHGDFERRLEELETSAKEREGIKTRLAIIESRVDGMERRPD